MRWARFENRGPLRRLVSAACTILAGGAAIAGLGGCAIVRNSLGTHDSACFKALPAADGAVHSSGRFGGLHFTTVGDLLAAVHRAPGGVVAPPPPGLHLPPRTGVCAVEYRGTFKTTAVLDGWSPTESQGGHFAIVLVRQSDLTVLATFVMQHEPLGFVRIFPHV